MSCMTLLVGKNASSDGSTLMARNEDAPFTGFVPKKFVVVKPEEQPRLYRSVISHVEVDLPEEPLRYTAMPNADPSNGLWASAGINAANVGMTACETITTNERVLTADPLVQLEPAADGKPMIPGGIGEEDYLTLVLPYIRSAREGVLRTASLLERYGTYESNGIGFSDANEIWWMETVGGHHWVAARVPDDCYAALPNWFNIDEFDLDDALGAQKNFMAPPDLQDFIKQNHLGLNVDGRFDPRLAFGSHTDMDRSANTPRAWYAQRCLSPSAEVWDGENADYSPHSDNIPWTRVPDRKISLEDVKYVLSSHYQGTKYDPYSRYGDPSFRGSLRPIGLDRNSYLGIMQIRPDMPREICALEWIAMGSNPFNALVPFYANIERTPAYLADTKAVVSTDSFYWANRIMGALADSVQPKVMGTIETYQTAVLSEARRMIRLADAAFTDGGPTAAPPCEQTNDEIAAMLRKKTDETLEKVLFTASCNMKIRFSREDV